MKKIYLAPKVLVVKTVPTTGILIGSDPNLNLTIDDETDAPEVHVNNGWDIWSDD